MSVRSCERGSCDRTMNCQTHSVPASTLDNSAFKRCSAGSFSIDQYTHIEQAMLMGGVLVWAYIACTCVCTYVHCVCTCIVGMHVHVCAHACVVCVCVCVHDKWQ